MCSSFTAVQLSNTLVVYEKTMLWFVELVTLSLSRLSVPLRVILQSQDYWIITIDPIDQNPDSKKKQHFRLHIDL